MSIHLCKIIVAACTLLNVQAIAQKLKVNVDSSVTTSHVVTIKGKLVPYTATVGTQPVWNNSGNAVAGLLYTYYQRTDVKNTDTRPLIVSFNGGPGSASVWMHIGYTGPRHLKIDAEGYPIQPYGMEDNTNSILDVADIVYVNPVNVGYSRPSSDTVGKKQFFGVNADIKYLADWVSTFVSRKNRWLSPKYLIGESYGTTRVAGLALELQEAHWMYLNGVILVSPTSLGIDRSGPIGAANMLPYYAATAWYHKVLPPALQQKDLLQILPEVEQFTITQLAPAITMGGFIDPAQRQSIAAKMALYSGLSEKVILQNNLVVAPSFFWKELLRDRGQTVGRLDSRYLGIDREDAGEKPDYAAELTSWLHSFTPAINHYMKNELHYNTDLEYYMFGPVHPWARDGAEADKTGDNLRKAMAENPYLHLMVQSGYYDGACDYFNAQYSMWNMDPSGKLKSRMEWHGYRSGHMMYLRAEDMVSSNDDIRAFIKNATPAAGKPAKY